MKIWVGTYTFAHDMTDVIGAWNNDVKARAHINKVFAPELVGHWGETGYDDCWDIELKSGAQIRIEPVELDAEPKKWQWGGVVEEFT